MQVTKADTAETYLGLPPSLTARVASVAAVVSGKLLASAPGCGANAAEHEGVAYRSDCATISSLATR